jgi:hypothetical protein
MMRAKDQATETTGSLVSFRVQITVIMQAEPFIFQPIVNHKPMDFAHNPFRRTKNVPLEPSPLIRNESDRFLFGSERSPMTVDVCQIA